MVRGPHRKYSIRFTTRIARQQASRNASCPMSAFCSITHRQDGSSLRSHNNNVCRAVFLFSNTAGGIYVGRSSERNSPANSPNCHNCHVHRHRFLLSPGDPSPPRTRQLSFILWKRYPSRRFYRLEVVRAMRSPQVIDSTSLQSMWHVHRKSRSSLYIRGQ